MRRMFSLICTAAGLGLSVGCADDRLPFPDLDRELEAGLREWLSEHAASPEDYVLSKFTDHDIVFLGEYHRIRHDPLLVQDLIPLLYPAGIRTLGIEFAAAADQADIDRLVEAEHFDQELANRMFWNLWP